MIRAETNANRKARYFCRIVGLTGAIVKQILQIRQLFEALTCFFGDPHCEDFKYLLLKHESSLFLFLLNLKNHDLDCLLNAKISKL